MYKRKKNTILYAYNNKELLKALPFLQALNPQEIQRALLQCKEHSREMLERACLAVEEAAKSGGVYPEVLFDTAHRWYEIYSDLQRREVSPSALQTLFRAPGRKELCLEWLAEELEPSKF